MLTLTRADTGPTRSHTPDRPAASTPATTPATLRFVDTRSGTPKVHIVPNGPPVYEGDHPHIPVSVENGRARADDDTVDTAGFELRRHDTAVTDFEDEGQVTGMYYKEVEALLTQATGASRVVIFDHTVRKDNNASGRTPARHVHNDYTAESAPQRLADVLGPEDAATAQGGRYAQVNVWRSIRGRVQRSPLAFLDARTVDPADLVRTEIHHPDRVGEIYGVRHQPNQRWVTFPNLDEHEVVLIKGFDSETDGRARFAPHTAFDDPATPADAPPRESIEVRAFLLFDA